MATRETLPFAVVLSHYRVAVGLTQEELAERAGLSPQAISALERGIRSRPRAYTVRQLIEALGLTEHDREVFEQAAVDAPASDTGGVMPTGDFLGALPVGDLVARVEEKERFRSIVGAVAEGTGHVVFLGGETGVGKTRLMQELMQEANVRGFVVLTGRCYPTEQETLYYPFLDALVGLTPHLSASVRGEGQRTWKKVQELASGSGAGNGAGTGTAVEQQQLFDTVSHLIVLGARLTPRAMLLDDLHWADDQTLKLLQHLAHSTRHASVLLAGSFRDVQIGEQHPELARVLQILSRERLAERITVRRLSLEETTALVAAIMDQEEVSEEFAHFVYRRTKGIPRLIDQLVRSLGGRLELQEEIGAGAMGRVFRAYDRTLEQTVAAKLVLARQEIDLDTLLRFQQEGAVLAQLDHPHIVDIYDSFSEEHASCIIMELLEGRSLAELVQEGPLPLERAKNLILQVADALSYAHAHQIVHRDIKPDNVMVLPHDQVKVTDFGIARILQPDTSLQTIATTGMRMGTPLYMAPEQIEGKKVDARTDLYALGAMLYHMVTGRPPFEGNDALAVAVKHLQEEPPRPSQVHPAIPADWDALILTAMAKDPAKRFQSAREVGDAVRSIGEQPGSRLRVATRPRWIAATAGVFALAAAVMAGVWAHAATGSHQSQLSSRMDAYLSGLAAHKQFSGTVLVAQKGDILLARGYGLADREDKVPNSPTTKYPVGGVSFSMTLAAGLKLEEQGKLHDSDSVCSYLASCGHSWKPMTIRVLLDGTSGLGDAGWGQAGRTTSQSLAQCETEPLTATPGAKLNYQNCTVVVLGTIIQKVTRQPWATAMRLLVLRPAGMQQSGRITDRLLPPARARDYSGSHPAGGDVYNDYFQLYSTASDLYRYDNALFAGKFLSQRSLDRLSAPRDTVDPSDPGIEGARWGYQWKTGTAFGHQVIYTTGNAHSFSTINMRFPARDVSIILISNDDQNDFMGVAAHIGAILFGEPVASSAAPLAPAVNPSRAIVATIKTPVGFGITAGAGAVWVPGPPGSGSVARIDPTTNKVVATVRINDPSRMDPGDPALTWVAVGHGQVWVTDRVHNAVARIDPATNRVVARVPLGIRPFGLAIGGNTLWADNSYEDAGVVRNTIVRVDLHTQKVVATITNTDTQLGQPYLVLAATPDALWFADWAGATLKRLSATTNKVVATVQTGPQPTSLAVAEGSIWVSNHFSDLVARVDPTTNSMAATIPLEGYPVGRIDTDCCHSAVAAGAGGVWTIAGSGNRALVRIDPQTTEATASLTFPESIEAVAVGDGSVWVEAPDKLYRIDSAAMKGA